MEPDEAYDEVEYINENSQFQKHLYDMGLSREQQSVSHRRKKSLLSVVAESVLTFVVTVAAVLRRSLKLPLLKTYLYDSYHAKKHRDFSIIVESLSKAKFLDYSERSRIFSISDDLQTLHHDSSLPVTWISSILAPQSIDEVLRLIDNCTDFNASIRAIITYLQDVEFVTHANHSRNKIDVQLIVSRVRESAADGRRRELRQAVFDHLRSVIGQLRSLSDNGTEHDQHKYDVDSTLRQQLDDLDGRDCGLTSVKAMFTLYKLYLSKYLCLNVEKAFEKADFGITELCSQSLNLNILYCTMNTFLKRSRISICNSPIEHNTAAEDHHPTTEGRAFVKCRELKLKLRLCAERIDALETCLKAEHEDPTANKELLAILTDDILSCTDCCSDLSRTIIGVTDIPQEVTSTPIEESVLLSEDKGADDDRVPQGCETMLKDAIFEGEADCVKDESDDEIDVTSDKVTYHDSSEKILRELRTVIHLREVYKSDAETSKPTFGIYGTIENSGDVQLPHCLPENKDIVTSQLEVVLHGDYDADDADKAIPEVILPVVTMSMSEAREVSEAIKQRHFASNLCTEITYGDSDTESEQSLGGSSDSEQSLGGATLSDSEPSLGGDTVSDSYGDDDNDEACTYPQYEYKPRTYEYSSCSSSDGEES